MSSMDMQHFQQDVTPPSSTRSSSLDDSGQTSPFTVLQLSEKLGAHSLSSRQGPNDAPPFFHDPFQRLPTPPAEESDAGPSDPSIAFTSPFSSDNHIIAPTISRSSTPNSCASSVHKSRPSPLNTSFTGHSSIAYSRSNVRAMRQRALRNQCSSSHLREIQDLVSRMVQNQELCSVRSRPSSRNSDWQNQPESFSSFSDPDSSAAPARSVDIDSEIDEIEERDVVMANDEMVAVLPSEPFDDEAMVLDQDSDLSEGGASAALGFRKLKYRRSNDWGSGLCTEAGSSRCVVRKSVRLRKRLNARGVGDVVAAVV